MAAVSASNLLKFFQQVFKGAAAGAGNILQTGKDLFRGRLFSPRQLQPLSPPGPDGFKARPAPLTATPQGNQFRPGQPQAQRYNKPQRPGGPVAASGLTYADGDWMPITSSWVEKIKFVPKAGTRGNDLIHFAIDDLRSGKAGRETRKQLRERGYLTMKTQNRPTQYTYPNVPRGVFNDMLRCPRGGRFYWYGYAGSPALLKYSARAHMRTLSKSSFKRYKGFRRGYR